MSLVPVMDVNDGRFVLRCTSCKAVFDTHEEFNMHPCALPIPVINEDISYGD